MKLETWSMKYDRDTKLNSCFWNCFQVSGFRFQVLRKGFTIIELLVVIAIISLIASLAVVQLSGVKARARDVERERDMKTFQTALALYVASRRVFPVYSGVITGTDAMSVALLADSAIPTIPKDPINSDVYVYSYESADGVAYTLRYTLETDRIPGKAAGEQSVTP